MRMYISHERVAGRDYGFDETKRLILTTREEKSTHVLINELPNRQHRSLLLEMVGAGKLCWEGGFEWGLIETRTHSCQQSNQSI
jgi:hypothetical protein